MNRKRIAVAVGVLGVVTVGGWILFPRNPTIHFVKFSRPGVAIFEIRNNSFSAFSFGGTLAPSTMVVPRARTAKGIADGWMMGGFLPGDLTIPTRTSIQVPVQVPRGAISEFRFGVQFKRGPAERGAGKPNKVEELIREIRRRLDRYLPKPEPTWSDPVPLPPVAVDGHRTAMLSGGHEYPTGI